MFDSRRVLIFQSKHQLVGHLHKKLLARLLHLLIPQNSGGDCPDVWSYHLKNYPTTVNTTGRSATIGKKNYTQLLRKNNWSPKRLQLFHMLSGVVVFGRLASWWFNFFWGLWQDLAGSLFAIEYIYIFGEAFHILDTGTQSWTYSYILFAWFSFSRPNTLVDLNGSEAVDFVRGYVLRTQFGRLGTLWPIRPQAQVNWDSCCDVEGWITLAFESLAGCVFQVGREARDSKIFGFPQRGIFACPNFPRLVLDRNVGRCKLVSLLGFHQRAGSVKWWVFDLAFHTPFSCGSCGCETIP